MTVPRQILKGSAVMVTRRTTQRKFLLKPGRTVNAILLYSLGYAIVCHPVDLFNYVFLSNHYHLALMDRWGHLPLFMACLNRTIAQCLNRLYGRDENLFDNRKYHMLKLEDPQAVLERMAYIRTNPVAAGLVASPDLWPGLCSGVAEIGAPAKTIERPNLGFSKATVLPSSVELGLVVPEMFRGEEEAFRSRLESTVEDRVRCLRESILGRGGFLGVSKVKKQTRDQRPSTPEERPRRIPRYASSDPARVRECEKQYRAFLSAYREAFERWRRREDGVVFPLGTWWLRVSAWVRVEGDEMTKPCLPPP